MKKYFLLIAFLIFLSSNLKSQNYDIVSSNGQTVTACTGYFLENGTGGNYAANQNLTVTFTSNNPLNTHISVSFITFDIDPSDTLFVYDGSTITSPLIGKFNNNNALSAGQNMVQASLNNNLGSLTFKFKSNASIQGAGWNSAIICTKPCQKIIAALDTILTTPHPNDSNYVDICLGASITFKANALFPQNDSVYHQSNASSKFFWDFGDGTIDSGQVVTKNYTVRRGYDIMLKIIDSLGCRSINAVGTRVRISSKPTSTIKPLADMCSGDTKLITAGYSPNSMVLIEPMGFTQTSKQGFDSTLFLPDGPYCLPGIYDAFVTFNNFPPGATITSANDILAICVNMEHSFAGDLGFKIYCPNGNNVQLDPNTTSSGNYMGVPYGGTAHHSYDNGCLPANNPPGVGWTYCWSEAAGYQNDNLTLTDLDGSSSPTRTVTINGGRTIDSTNQTNHTKYIKPQQALSGLVGCPLNGVWNIEIKDDYGSDNGYIFGWNLELTSNLMPNNWTYNVKIDSVGFSGPFIYAINDTTAIIAPTVGGNNFIYTLSLVDEFGCAWDTTTTMNVITTPKPDLGSDTALCYPYTTILDPGNVGSTYLWTTPSGAQTTQTIISEPINNPSSPSLTNYIVAATNYNTTHTLTCTGRDTITIVMSPTPLVSYTTTPPDQYIVGCDPLSVSFENTTTPPNSTYFWDFGDGQTSTDENPTHSFAAGSYTVKLTATSINGGCTHTFSSFSNSIKSFAQPIADFTWNPPIGTRQNPIINFSNLTTPINSSFTWDWSFYGPLPDSTKLLGNSSLQNPSYKFEGDYKEEKEYLVTLIAKSDFGCTDTNSYTVKIIDDLLIFPNILTPNGDGVNDKFEIGALMKGGGYTEMQVIIYNRWGKKVYENNNYKNDFDGEGLPDGVYYVTIKAKGLLKDVEYKSSLEILR